MKITKSILTAAVLTAVSASVFAAETTLPSTVNTDTNGTTIGVNNSIAGKNNIAVGVGNNITGRNSVAIGYHNTASAYKMPADDELIDLSVNPVADGVGSTAIGSFSKVYNQLGTAIGYNASVTGDNNVAVGSYSTTGDVHATDNKYAGVTNNRGVVSIGSIDPAVNLIYDGMEAPEKQSWQNDFTRQIQRVSAGEVSATSTDAVNGSQLQDAFDRSTVNATNITTNAANIIKAKTTVTAGNGVTVTDSTNANGSTNYEVAVARALTDQVEANKNAIANLNDNAVVQGGENIHIADVNGNQRGVSLARNLQHMESAHFGHDDDSEDTLITKNSIEMGSNITGGYTNMTADAVRTFNGSENTGMTAKGITIENTDNLDQASFTVGGMQASDANGTVRFTTTDITAGNQQIHGVKAGVADTDAVNVKQLKDATSAAATTVSGSGAVEVTTSTNSNGSTNYNVSLNTDGIREIAKTSNRYAGDKVVKVERWNNPTGSADLTTFKFNENEAAKVLPITYKANGEDAKTTTASKGLNFVDGNHINASVDNNGIVKFDLDKSVTDRIDSNTNNIKANADAIKKLTAANTANLGGLTDKVNTLSSKVDENQREARRGIASASALAALHPLDYDPTHKVDVMAGVGHYRGNTAVALGAAYRPNENMMFTVGASINGKDSAINAGVSYKVGTKEGVESKYSKVAMQRHIDELNTTVAEQNEKIEQLNNLVEKLLEEVHQSN